MPALDLLIDGVDFGEGPRWHEGRLWYSDFFQHAVYTVDARGRREQIVEVPQQPSGLGWLPDGSLLGVSMLDHQVLRYADRTLRQHADLSAIARGPCNDMTVDSRGRAYVGNFGEQLGDGPPEATLALVTPDGRAVGAIDRLQFPNGSVITPDGRTLIIGETAGGRYTACTIEPDGTLSGRRVWATLDGYAPDGCTLDAEGAIWFADARGQRVVRVREGGEITHTIDVPANTYACTLGGEDGRTLFILTALSFDAATTAGRGAGQILTTRVDVPHAGLP